MKITKKILKSEFKGFLICLGFSLIVISLTHYAPPGPTLIEKCGFIVAFGAQIYLFILICRILAKGIVYLFQRNK